MPRKKPSLQKLQVRELAYDVALPEEARQFFTTAQLAVLAVIRDECASNTVCRLIVSEIAKRAGVKTGTATLAVKIAKDIGVISVSNAHSKANIIVNRHIDSWTTIHNAETLPFQPPR
jgi:ribosomal protein S25